MVYVEAARKTGAYMLLSIVLSVAILTFMSGDLTDMTTGRVTSTGIATDIESGAWMLFLLGILVGAIVVGTFFYVVHIEHKRDE